MQCDNVFLTDKLHVSSSYNQQKSEIYINLIWICIILVILVIV